MEMQLDYIDPEQIVRRYYQILNDRQPEAAEVLLHDDVRRIGTLQTDAEPKVTQGKADLLTRIRRMVEDNATIEARDFVVDGEKVTCIAQVATDTIRSEGVAPLEETAEFLVQEGRIRSYRVVLTPASMAKLKAAGIE